MSATYCIAAVEREVRAAPVLSARVLRRIAESQPKTCDRPDCSPGGCRKHAIEFLTGVAARAGIPTKGKP